MRPTEEEVQNPAQVLDHERIKVAVDALQSPDVIGDCSRVCNLTCIFLVLFI